jgi:hypothetical protein
MKRISGHWSKVVLALSLMAEVAHAGMANGHINEIVSYPSGSALINVNGSYTDAPACNVYVSAGYNRFNIDTTSATGRAVYATLLTAMHAGTGVFVGGDGTCKDGAEGVTYTFSWPSP